MYRVYSISSVLFEDHKMIFEFDLRSLELYMKLDKPKQTETLRILNFSFIANASNCQSLDKEFSVVIRLFSL